MARPVAASASASASRRRAPQLPWQRLGVVAAVALALSLGLVLYLFGWADHFASRLLTAFFVGFVLLAATFMGILPFIAWATTHWFGPGWTAEAARPLPKRRAASAAASRASSSTTS